MTTMNESLLEQAALDILRAVGYGVAHGPQIAPGEVGAERESLTAVLLPGRLAAGLARVNPGVAQSALNEARRVVSTASEPGLAALNRRWWQWLAEGVDVEYRKADGQVGYTKVWLVDYARPENNDWLAVDQFTVVDGQQNKRPDIVLFCNGIPLVVIELKNPTKAETSVQDAFNQLNTYKAKIPALFGPNALLIISDGIETRMGSLTAKWSWFKPWPTVDGVRLSGPTALSMEVLLTAVCQPGVLLDLLRYFTVFEENGGDIIKKIAQYHQYYAVNKAVETTVAAVTSGDRKAGVMWHTQGSGKSLSMLFYAGKVIQRPEMKNPTVVVLTDRNDLDEQLYGTFTAGQLLLRQTPVQASSRRDMREKLHVASGGVVFTTIQKFSPYEDEDAHPLLSDRSNIVFIADEAHRSQYGFGATVRDEDAALKYGLAKYMRDALPNATFIGFTGTPVELVSANTKQVFGDYIDKYDIKQAVDDGATVRIYYEARMAELRLYEAQRAEIDPEMESILSDQPQDARERWKSRWSALEAAVGAQERIDRIAADIVRHYDERESILRGKAMVVCMSRRIAVAMYDALVKLRPEWQHDDPTQGAIKVVMTGSSADPPDLQKHVYPSAVRRDLAKRFKDEHDGLKVAVVCDMWLTGFDVPALHTMYIDKPMRGHTLMQAIARVNRVFEGKDGGLVVDYIGLAADLKAALAFYSSDTDKFTGAPQQLAVDLMNERYEVVRAMYRGFDYSAFFSGAPLERMKVLPAAMDHILSLPEGQTRYSQQVGQLARAFGLALPHADAIKIRDEVAFFLAVKAGFEKGDKADSPRLEYQIEGAIRQLVGKSVSSGEVIDVLSAAGFAKADFSIFSEQFMEEVRNAPYKNLAIEALQRLLRAELATRMRTNVVEARSFLGLLEETLNLYNNRQRSEVEIIEDLLEIGQKVVAARSRGEAMGLTDEEVAFYDALALNQSAVEVLGDDNLRVIARELVEKVRKNVSIDWNVKESARANMRIIVKRILRRRGYPPDMTEKATDTVIEQAEALTAVWAPG